jgi:hypothetical protein
MTKQSKKVAQGSAQEAEGEQKKKKGRIVFDLSTAKAILPVLDKEGKPTKDVKLQSALNKDGKLIALPLMVKDGDKVVYQGWDAKVNKGLAKKDFGDEPTYLNYKALVLEGRAQRMLTAVASLRDKATRLGKFGDAATRRKVKKIERMQETLAKLKSELTADGINIEELDVEESTQEA